MWEWVFIEFIKIYFSLSLSLAYGFNETGLQLDKAYVLYCVINHFKYGIFVIYTQTVLILHSHTHINIETEMTN